MPIDSKQLGPATETVYDYHPGVGDTNTSLLLVSGTVYALALPVTAGPRTVARVVFRISSAGAGTIVGEYGIGTSPSTVIAAVGATAVVTPKVAVSLAGTTLTAAGDKNVAFSYTIPGGVQPWLLIRTALTTTQPTFQTQYFSLSGLKTCRSLAAGGVITVGSALNFSATDVAVPSTTIVSV